MQMQQQGQMVPKGGISVLQVQQNKESCPLEWEQNDKCFDRNYQIP